MCKCYDTATTQSHIPDAVRDTAHRRWSEQGEPRCNGCAIASATLCAFEEGGATTIRQHAFPAKSQKVVSLMVDEEISDDLIAGV